MLLAHDRSANNTRSMRFKTSVHDRGRRLNQRLFRPMAEVSFLPHAEYKEKRPLLAGNLQGCLCHIKEISACRRFFYLIWFFTQCGLHPAIGVMPAKGYWIDTEKSGKTFSVKSRSSVLEAVLNWRQLRQLSIRALKVRCDGTANKCNDFSTQKFVSSVQIMHSSIIIRTVVRSTANCTHLPAPSTVAK